MLRKSKLLNSVVIIFAAVVYGLLYEWQISETNAYVGYLPAIFTLQASFLSFAMLLCVVAIVPYSVRRPSDFFLLFYAVIVLLSFSLFWHVTGLIDSVTSILLYFILLIPVICVLLFRRLSFPTLIHGLFDKNIVYYSILIVVVIAVVVGAAAQSDSGFGWESVYERRIAGRESIGSRNITAYLLSMSMNGFGPFLAFIGVLRNKLVLLIAGLFLGVYSFWLIGLKAPFVMVLVFMVMGHYLRNGRLTRFPAFVGWMLAVLGVLSLVEFLSLDNSLLAEYGVRRAFVVQGAVQSYFFNMIEIAFRDDVGAVLFGIDPAPYESLTFAVGANYLNHAESNVNTNAFLYALSSGGILAFFLASMFVGGFFAFLDSIYRETERGDVLFVAAIYALLITEQAFTTAFVSSGIGAVLVAILFMRRDSSDISALKVI